MSDIFIGPDLATDAEAAAVDAALADLGVSPTVEVDDERLVRGGVHRRNERRHALLPALHALQRVAGWISPGGVNHIAQVLAVPPAEIFGVATFYHLFRTDEPNAPEVLHVCEDAACLAAGAEERMVELRAGGAVVVPSPCLGQCERAVADVSVATFTQRVGAPDSVPTGEIAEPGDFTTIPQQGEASLRLLKRIGRYDPTSFSGYVGQGGYRALTAAFGLGMNGVLDTVEASGLTGRGGAGFPTGMKWRSVAPQPGWASLRYLVVNADESEIGTFKDRHLLEHDPFAVVEAATIAGFATGAVKGYVYIRGEYPVAAARLQGAIDAARAEGMLGERIARSSYSFDLEIRMGAGAYICGEETALLESIEGKRGEPRQKPPFPTVEGLFGAPTVINNVETLVNVLGIVSDGVDAYRSVGSEGAPGTKLYCLSGHLASPGVYEWPFGTTLRDALVAAGADVDDLAAVLLGGGAGTFVLPDEFDLPLDPGVARAAGHSLGSGVIMAFDRSTDFDAVVTSIARFFRDESCGQCVPCRIGTTRQHELLTRTLLAEGGPTGLGPTELTLLDDMDKVMKDASICGLGHTAATAVRSAIAAGLVARPSGTEQPQGDQA